MSVWKKIPIAPGGVMPGGLVTKIGVAAISLLLAAMLLTYTFTGGGGPEAEVDVPEAAGFDLQQRAAAAIEAEARRQAEQLRLQADTAERQLAELQNAQESTAALVGAGIVGLPGQDPGTGVLADDQPVPFAGDAPRSEAEAVLLETLRLEEMERRRRSLRTEPLVLSYRNAEAAEAEGTTTAGGAPLPDAASAFPAIPPAQALVPPPAGVTAQDSIATAGEFLQLLTELNDRELAANAQFDLDLQATEIGNQVQEIVNRVTRYTTLLNQFTSLDCSAQGMASGAEATPINEAVVVCDTLNMLGAFTDSYQQLLGAPTDLLNTPVPLPDWRDLLQQADTVSDADIRNVYQSGPHAADAAVATFQRQRDYSDRSVVLSHAQADAAAALTDTLNEAERVVADLEARNSVTRTDLAQTKLAATLTRARLIVAMAQLRAYQASVQAADAYNAEIMRREIETRGLAERAALEAQWAREQAALPAGAGARIESMYGGYRLHPVFFGN